MKGGGIKKTKWLLHLALIFFIFFKNCCRDERRHFYQVFFILQLFQPCKVLYVLYNSHSRCKTGWHLKNVRKIERKIKTFFKPGQRWVLQLSVVYEYYKNISTMRNKFSNSVQFMNIQYKILVNIAFKWHERYIKIYLFHIYRSYTWGDKFVFIKGIRSYIFDLILW